MPNPFRRKVDVQESTPPAEWEVEKQVLQNNYGLLQESIRDLESQIIESGWQRIGSDSKLEFSRGALQQLINYARVMAVKNPLIHADVTIEKNYVFGQGCQVSAVDPEVQAVIEEFENDKGNRDALTSHEAQTMNEVALQTDGNLFFTLFSDTTQGIVRVRSIIVDQISDIITNPDDSQEPWFYRREWTLESVDPSTGLVSQRPMIAYYAHLDLPNNPPPRSAWGMSWPETIGGHPVFLDPRIYHVKVGHLKHMKFGLPDFYSAIDWAVAYKDFLQDAASTWKSLSIFSWKRIGGKTRKALTNFKNRLNTGRTSTTGETNPAPVPGAIAAMSDGTDLTPIPKSGATIATEDGRFLRLMVSSGTGIPDTMLSGDPQQGALATAKTLDRPTELGIRDRQKLWMMVRQDICAHVIEVAVEAGVLKGNIEVNAYGSKRVVLIGTDPDRGGERDASISVTFPSILEHDVKNQVDAIVAAAPYLPRDLVAERLMTALGVEDVQDRIEDMGDEEEEVEPASPQAEALRNVIDAAKAVRESIQA